MGAPAGFENTLLRGAWSRDDGGKRVGVGGADRTVCIWDVESGGVQYKLPGHRGTVTSVDFHPKEPISECAFVVYLTRVLTWPDSFDGKQRRDHAPRRDRAELDGVGPYVCICNVRLFVKRSALAISYCLRLKSLYTIPGGRTCALARSSLRSHDVSQVTAGQNRRCNMQCLSRCRVRRNCELGSISRRFVVNRDRKWWTRSKIAGNTLPSSDTSSLLRTTLLL